MTSHENHPTDTKEQRYGWKKPIAVLIAAGSFALLGAACSNETTDGAAKPATTTSVSAESGTSATGAHMEGDTNADGKFSFDELNAMIVNDVENISAPKLVQAYAAALDSTRQATYDKMLSTGILPAEAKDVINVPTGPKANYTDQQVVNQVAIDIASVYLHDTPTDGPRALPTVISPDAKNYSDVRDLVGASNTVPKSLDAVEASVFAVTPKGTSLRVSGTFDGTSLADYSQAREIQLTIGTGPNQEPTGAYGLYGLVSNPDGTDSWRLIRLDNGGDVHLQSYIADLVIKQSGEK